MDAPSLLNLTWLIGAVAALLSAAISYFVNIAARNWQTVSDERRASIHRLVELIENVADVSREYYCSQNDESEISSTDMSEGLAINSLSAMTAVVNQFRLVEYWVLIPSEKADELLDVLYEAVAGEALQSGKGTVELNVARVNHAADQFKFEIQSLLYRSIRQGSRIKTFNFRES